MMILGSRKARDLVLVSPPGHKTIDHEPCGVEVMRGPEFSDPATNLTVDFEPEMMFVDVEVVTK
jgi:hypothetical protein